MSRSSLQSSNPSSRSDDSTETTSTAASDLSKSGSSDSPHHINNGMDSHELKGERPAFLSFFSSKASKQKGPKYSTAPSLDDIFRRHHVIDPQSIVDNARLSIIPYPDDKMLDWTVGLTLYPDPSNPGKIGSNMTHLGVDTTKADKAAGIYAVDIVDPSARNASAAFTARISRQNNDLVNTFNAGDNTEVNMEEIENAKTAYARFYEIFDGAHTVSGFRNLLPTFEEKSQQYICKLRAKKQLASQLPLEFGGSGNVSIQWVENEAPEGGN
jgi:hypothetical protein